MPKQYSVNLTEQEQAKLQDMVKKGHGSVRQIRRAHTLLLS